MSIGRILKIILFAAYLAFVAWLCFGTFHPSPKVPRAVFGFPIDKFIHFTMFLPFPILGTMAFSFRSWWRTLSISTLAANLIAFVFENLQSRITATRVTDPADLNANLLGITAGLLIAVITGFFIKKKDFLLRSR